MAGSPFQDARVWGMVKTDVHGPNDVWTVDFKGWWRTRNGKRFEPLTVRDAFSRYVLCLRMLSSMAAKAAKPANIQPVKAGAKPVDSEALQSLLAAIQQDLKSVA